MKTTKKLLCFLLTLALFITGISTFGVKDAKASYKYESFMCYAKNCKMTDKNRYAKVSIKGNKLRVSGWTYQYVEKGGKDHMEWKKLNKQYPLSSKISYIDETHEWIKKAKFEKKLKKYGSAYDSIWIVVENKKVTSVKIQDENATVKNKSKIPDNTEIKVWTQGSVGSVVGHVCPLEHGEVSIVNKDLVIKGVITYLDASYKIIRLKPSTRKFKIKCVVNKKVKKQIEQRNQYDYFYFYLKKGKVVSMGCDVSNDDSE